MSDDSEDDGGYETEEETLEESSQDARGLQDVTSDINRQCSGNTY